ncbi:MAG: 3-phosphoshikimate 1-carboxyvinyltransferase [Cyclobacteriaceae bacterium]|nr:3-phosphoshikimate 1-carboxyvinyltransferase [Cyclobacteriaceae bacterium HetDA_MAG_MS6]
MQLQLHHYQDTLNGIVPLSSSKSESNRALLIQALCQDSVTLKNISDARDTQTMQRLITENAPTWDVLDAGTTMRFCTAYLALMGKDQVITGTERMQQRPIGVLVDALRMLGADIQYLGNDGYPPLKIAGLEEQKSSQLKIPGNISSQFISALLMIGPSLPKGLTLQLTTEVFSRPYIEMTLSLMAHFGVKTEWKENEIHVASQAYQSNDFVIESDWSGASYWYAMVALNSGSTLTLNGLKAQSTQGDQAIVDIMTKMGVTTLFDDRGAHLAHAEDFDRHLELDFKKCPDLAQTVMVVAAAKGISLKMTGLESLKIKETDRIAGMTAELSKIGTLLIESADTWTLKPGQKPEKTPVINTYEDHRMAMAFAPLCNLYDIKIDDPDVVKKSYPGFWEHLKKHGVVIREIP